ncbi:MAG: hydrolase [Gammaproteobacteria bacterium]
MDSKLLRAHNSCLLIVDVQEKLVPAVRNPEDLVANCVWLMGVASVVGVPMLISEQYPAGLGPTVAPLQTLAPRDVWMEKVHFSCAEAPHCNARIEAVGRMQMVLAGIEAHVCVLQTALGLCQAGKDVFVVADAVSSRNERDVDIALARMRTAGVQVVTKEMVLFEWAHQAATAQFRELSANFLKRPS